MGFLPITPGGANLFFQLFNARYEKGAMILTSNLGFADCGEMFGNPVIATDLVQEGNDSGQLEPMMTQLSEAMDSVGLVGLADGGYFNGDQLKECEDLGMEMYVPPPDNATDSYVCPVGHKLLHSGTTGMKLDKKYLVNRSDVKVCNVAPWPSAVFPVPMSPAGLPDVNIRMSLTVIAGGWPMTTVR